MINKIMSLVLLFFLASFIGCDDNPTDGGTIGGIGGGTSGGVTFAIMSQDGQNGGIEFHCKPSVDVTLTSVNVKVPAASYENTYDCDGVSVYSKTDWYLIDEFTGTTSGMQFVFKFIGKTSPEGKPFDVTTNYTVP
jgi:hypothetical protein